MWDERFLSIPPLLSTTEIFPDGLEYFKQMTRNFRAPGAAHISDLFSEQWADRFHRALSVVLSAGSPWTACAADNSALIAPASRKVLRQSSSALQERFLNTLAETWMISSSSTVFSWAIMASTAPGILHKRFLFLTLPKVRFVSVIPAYFLRLML